MTTRSPGSHRRPTPRRRAALAMLAALLFLVVVAVAYLAIDQLAYRLAEAFVG